MQAMSFAQNLDSGLVGYWPFNGNAKDMSGSGNGNDGVVHGATLTFDRCGNPNSAYSFNGIDNSIEISNNPILTNIENTNEFTVTAWIRIDKWYIGTDSIKSFAIFNKWDLPGSNNLGLSGWELIIYPQTNLSFNFTTLKFPFTYISYFYNNFNLNQWCFIALTYSLKENKFRYFINYQKCIDTVCNYQLQHTTKSLYIGYSPLGIDEYANGIIDEFRIYNRALTEKEVSLLYNMPEKRATIHTPDTITNVGTENFHIPIEAKLNCQQMLAENLSFTAKIKFNASTFLPTGLTKGNYKDSIDKDFYRILTIRCDSSDGVKISETDSILTELVGTVLLGDSITPIEITDFKWNNSNIEIDTIIDGSLRTTTCAFPIRRIQLFTPTTLLIQPNPTNSVEIEIKFEGDEEGLHTLNFYNNQGIKIDSKEWLNAKNNKRDFKFNLNDYPNGVYYIVLKSPWNVISKPLMVMK